MEGILNPQNQNNRSVSIPPEARHKRKFPITLVYFLLLIAIVWGTAYVIKTKPEILGLSKSMAANEQEVKEVVAKAGKIIELPEGETPTLATVSDLEKVKEQTFFKNAKVGDKVLVYQQAKKAYIYRPSEKKIIEVGVVNLPPVTETAKEGEVAGQKSETIEVITPTLLPTKQAVATLTPTPKPTLQVTKALTAAPTATPAVNP